MNIDEDASTPVEKYTIKNGPSLLDMQFMVALYTDKHVVSHLDQQACTQHTYVLTFSNGDCWG